MANEYILKSFDGGAQTTTLTSAFTVNNATLSVANGTSFPDGSAGKFVVVVDRGLATEEKFLITSTSGTSNVTFTISNAGYDGTSPVNHNVGATVDHCLDAYTVEQANRYVNLQQTKGSLVTHTGTATATHTASATNNLALLTDSTIANGIKWGQVPTAGIVDSAVTTAKIADSNVTLSKLAAAVQNLLVPAGVIVATLKSTADTGWIALNGTPVAGASGTYPSLYAATSGIAGWWSGSTFTPPNMTNKMLEGVGTTAVGQEGGSNTATLGVSNLPAHTHTASSTSSSTSTVTDPGHSHTLTNGSLVVRQDGGGNADLTADSSYGPYNTYTLSNVSNTTGISVATSTSTSTTVSGGGNGTSTGDAVTVTNAHIAVYYQIKAH
jgi:microcystin-dependent protein